MNLLKLWLLFAVILIVTVSLAMCYDAHAGSHHYRSHHRSQETTREFQRLHPCPSTGLTYGSCPGYIKDHIIALCKGGPDTPDNMQWQTVQDAKAKDKIECK